jgi:hypothetical protein
MVDISPDIALKATVLRAKYAPYVRSLDENFVMKALEEAEVYRGLHIAFWRSKTARFLFIYRLDRLPTKEEVMPWLQELFADGQIHEHSQSYFRSFIQGDIYTTDTVADMIGDSFANAADQDSNADAFDLDKTEVGQKLLRQGDGR